MRLTTIALAVMLAGCSGLSGPAAIKAHGSRIDFDSIRSPEAAMQCVLKNAERYRGRYTGNVRAGDQSGTQELVIKTAAGLNGYGFAEPNAVGSHVSVWLNELVDAREALEAFRAGC